MRNAERRAAAASSSSRATAGHSTRSRTSWKCNAAARRHRMDARRAATCGRRTASSRFTCGGIWRSIISSWAKSTKCSSCSTADPWRALEGHSRPDRCIRHAVAPASARHRCRQPLAERRRLWAPVATAGNYAFNDVHAVMAFIGAGRRRSRRGARIAASRHGGVGDNATFTREVGPPARSPCGPSARATMPSNRATVARRARDRASLRRQPRAARPARPHVDRSRNPFGRESLASALCAERASQPA